MADTTNGREGAVDGGMLRRNPRYFTQSELGCYWDRKKLWRLANRVELIVENTSVGELGMDWELEKDDMIHFCPQEAIDGPY